MSCLLRVVTLAVLVFFAGSSLSAQDQPKPAGPALLLSLFVGFGTGQYYCGTDGTKFLVSDLAGLTMTAVVLTSPGILLSAGSLEAAFTFLVFGPVTFLVSRIWQILDVFCAIDEARKAGRVAEVVPAINVGIRRTSFDLGVSLRY